MAPPLKLEVFETPDQFDGPVTLLPEEIEEIRLNAYERGYAAGWDDGGHQADADDSQRRSAIARQVEQLGFTYHEARAHVLGAIEPLLRAMLDSVLPVAVRAAVVPQTIDQLMPLAHAAAEAPIRLLIAPGSRAAFEQAFEGLVLPPIDLVETDAMAEGQAEFAFDGQRTRVDLRHAAEALGRAIDRFYLIQTEESRRA